MRPWIGHKRHWRKRISARPVLRSGKAREIWPESPRIVEVSAAVEKAESEYREKQQRQEKMVLLLQEARSLNEEGQDTEGGDETG